MHLFNLAKRTELFCFGIFTLGVVAQEANSNDINSVDSEVLK